MDRVQDSNRRSRGSPTADRALELEGELSRSREQLRESEERFRSIIERAADGIVIVGSERTILFVNPAAERLFGRGAAELLGSDFGRTLVSGETVEIDLVRPAGAEAAVAELRVTDTSWEGHPAQLVTLRDVTDRRQAEERAHRLVEERAARERAEQANQRSRFLAETSAALDASLDAEETLARIARLLVPRLGDWCVVDLLEDGELRRVAGLHADADRQRLLEQLGREYPVRPDSPQPAARVIESCEPQLHRGLTAERIRSLSLGDAHAELLARLGARSAIAVPLLARDGCLGAITLVCAERDFDEEDLHLAGEIALRAGRALENARLYEDALRANRAKSDFLAVISHELRTPLNAILGYTDLMLSGAGDDAGSSKEEQLQRIRMAAGHLLQLIEEVLTFAQADAGQLRLQPVEVPLDEMMEEIASLAEPLARKKGLAFTCEPERSGDLLFTDSGKVRQIAAILLSNAVKFTGEGSVTLRAKVGGDALVLSVSDTGPGIEEADRERVFRPFWQAENPLTRKEGGTGLGLSVARRLSETLGGELTLESRPGVGSTFTLRVPARLAATDDDAPDG